MFGIFNRKSAKDPYLERVAASLHKTLGPVFPSQNAYDLAAECLDELKANIVKGMFRPGPNPREAVMAYYCLCSMVRESGPADNREMVLKTSIMAQILEKQLEDRSSFTPLEQGICLFGEKALSETFPTHTDEQIAQLKSRAAEIIVHFAGEQGESVSGNDMRQLVENVASNIGDREIYKGGDKLLALSALASITANSIDNGDIRMANVYSQCFFATVDRYVKGKMESFDDYQNGAIKTIMRGYSDVVQELMKANIEEKAAQLPVAPQAQDDGPLRRSQVALEEKPGLVEMVEKKHSTALGLFEDLNRDLASYIERNESDDPLRRMAYAYARRTAMAGLYFQGIVGENVLKHVQDIFVAYQRTTGQTINFQRDAAHQAFELVQSYIPRMRAEHEKALLFFTRQGITAIELADTEGHFEIDPIEDDPVSIDKCLDLLGEVLNSQQIPGVNSDTNEIAVQDKTLLDLVEKSSAAKLGAFASMSEDVRASADQFAGNDMLFGAAGYAILLGACGAYVAGGVHPKLIADYTAVAKTLMDGIENDRALQEACKKQAFDLGSTYVRGLTPEAAEVILKAGLQLEVFAGQGEARLSPEVVVKHAKRMARDEVA